MSSIGDFARFAGVSVRMLRHYDAVGLLDADLSPSDLRALLDPEQPGVAWYDADGDGIRVGAALPAGNGGTPAGPCREVYLSTPPDRPDDWVTELQQPVR